MAKYDPQDKHLKNNSVLSYRTLDADTAFAYLTASVIFPPVG
jgi:hypothetical protein